MTAEEEFEEWFRRQDPEPTPTCFSDCTETSSHKKWMIRFYCAKLGYLEAYLHQQEKIDEWKRAW